MRSKHLSVWSAVLVGLSLTIGTDAGRAQLPGGGVAPVSNGVGSSFELTFWQSVATSEDRSQYEAYLVQYPNGTFAALARAKIAAIERARGIVPAPAAPPPTPALPPAPVPAAQPVATPVASPPLAATIAPPVTAAGPMPPPSAAPAAPVAVPDAAPAVAPVAAPPVNDPYAKLRAAMAARNAAAAGAPPSQLSADSAAVGKPVLAAIPSVALPDHFCSAEERNRFHETVYKPAVTIADQNNRAAIAYLDKLQADYDARSSRREIEAANAVAREAAAYKPVAEDAYAKRSAFTGLFDRIMAVPIAACS